MDDCKGTWVTISTGKVSVSDKLKDASNVIHNREPSASSACRVNGVLVQDLGSVS